MRGRIKEMRKNGFEHETICSLIAGKRCIIFTEIELNSSVQVIQERQVRMRKAFRACLACWKTPRKKKSPHSRSPMRLYFPTLATKALCPPPLPTQVTSVVSRPYSVSVMELQRHAVTKNKSSHLLETSTKNLVRC
ncbi:hypothetical protein DVH05_019999 [Phytophthora capsici]|nr:hypothetical protein DVH05_019999 [Phytophthora capsici]